MPHLCPVCQKEDWHDLDMINIPCPKCMGQKVLKISETETKPCDLCNEKGKINFQLRDQKYWFDENILYDEPVGMVVCKECGFVTYKPRWTEEKLKAYYTTDRTAVNPGLLVRGKIKNEFHKEFLELKYFEGDLKEKSVYSEVGNIAIDEVLDIGCSFGYVRDLFPTANIQGIEYAENLAKYAQKANGIKLKNDIKEIADKSLDLVMIYHTFEHVNNPRETLNEIKRVLKPEGVLYLAVPDYFRLTREVSGSACLSFERLYHINHNNVFSHASLNNILRQCGFEVLKMNNEYYGEAVLCKVNDGIDKTIEVEKWEQIEGRLFRQRCAIDWLSKSYNNQNADQAVMGIEAALSQCPDYVDAYEALMMQRNNYRDIKAIRGVFNRAKENGCATPHLKSKFANLLMNWSDAGKINNCIREAQEIFETLLKTMPFEMESLVGMAKICAHFTRENEKALDYCDRVLKLNPLAWADIQNIKAHLYCSN